MRGLPKCRTKDIIIKQLDDETLIYDLKTHEATCLNEAASAIYNDCDGSLSIEDLCELHGEFETTTALAKFHKADLIEDGFDMPSLVSRRDALRKITGGARLGMAVASIPAMATIAVPTAAQAASCLRSGFACSSDSECCGICDTGSGPGFCIDL